MTDADTEDVKSAVVAFLALSSDARLAASPYVFQNYRCMVDDVGEDEVEEVLDEQVVEHTCAASGSSARARARRVSRLTEVLQRQLLHPAHLVHEICRWQT